MLPVDNNNDNDNDDYDYDVYDEPDDHDERL